MSTDWLPSCPLSGGEWLDWLGLMDGSFYELCKVWGRSELFSPVMILRNYSQCWSQTLSGAEVVTATNMVPTVCIMTGDYSLSDIIIIIIIIIQVVITTAQGCLTQIPHHSHSQIPGTNYDL